MTPVSALPTTPNQAELAAFRASLQASNPFLDNRINGPSLHDSDVPRIHQPTFARLTGLAEEALRARRGLGVMLWGEAGIGKSHVLSRLARWAGDRVFLVYLHNLQAAPAQLPRSLLRSVISQLTLGRRREFYGTRLFSLVHTAVLANLPPGERVVAVSRIQRIFEEWVNRLVLADLPGAASPDRSVYEILFRFYLSACQQKLHQGDGRAAELAVRWLAGEGLDPDDAALLDLSPAAGREEAVALFDAQQIKQVLVALMHLASCQQRPFILAFDQVDNLDGEQFAALARFLETLIDSAPNLLVITAGIQVSLVGWREQGVIQESAWDRLAQFQLPLHRISADEAGQIVRARLQAFLQPFAALEPIAHRIQADPLFPLGEPWRKQFLQDRVDLRPRDVINWASEGWRQLQDRLRRETANWLLGPDSAAVAPGPVADNSGPRTLTETAVQERIDQQLRDCFAERCQATRAAPQTLPPDEDRVIRLIRDLLLSLQEWVPTLGLTGVDLMEARGALPAPHQLVVIRELAGGGRLRTGVLILATDNKTTITTSLRRLISGAGIVDRQVLVWDARIGLPLGTKGREYLDYLEKELAGQFLALEITLDEYAELDALHGVIGLARSGELEIEMGGHPRPVTIQQTVESLHRQGRFRESRVLRELT